MHKEGGNNNHMYIAGNEKPWKHRCGEAMDTHMWWHMHIMVV